MNATGFSQSNDLHNPFGRKYNFNAGPAILPLEVLQKAQSELLNFNGSGMSVMEMSHRSAVFEGILGQAEADLRLLLGIPQNYKVLFLQGGASLQFAMVPVNLRPGDGSADYILNGAWSKAAINDAQKLGRTRIVASSETTGFDRFPDINPEQMDSKAAYLHYTSNETIHGVQCWQTVTAPSDVPVICDMSSDFLGRPVDVNRYGLIYAGAQKNAGPAGVTMVIIREDLLGRVPNDLPVMLDYRLLAKAGSMHNTPPCFAIYMVGLVLQWLIAQGGLDRIAERNRAKANLIYTVIDESAGFYRGHAEVSSRSVMNVTFRLPDDDLEKRFVKKAEENNLIGLKGHRSVGGLRASLYNALPVESAQVLSDFMREFQRENG